MLSPLPPAVLDVPLQGFANDVGHRYAFVGCDPLGFSVEVFGDAEGLERRAGGVKHRCHYTKLWMCSPIG